MDVIARTRRQECREHGRPAEPGHYLRCPECDGPMVFVEYDLVPAGQLRGAVDLLREARFYVDARATGSVKAAKLLDRIDAALPPTGGQ